MHIPVLKNEVLKFLRVKPGQVIVDATFGEGGHARAILEQLADVAGRERAAHAGPGKLIGLDRDPQAIDAATHKFAKEIAAGRLVLVQARFSELANVLQSLSHPSVDGIVMDLGVSTQQILSPTRGFSFLSDAPLDMRMDPQEDFTAARLLVEWDERQLVDLFRLAGEQRFARRLARAIVLSRRQQPLQTTKQLAELVERTIPAAARRSSKHVATRVFLGLRMAVNHELEEIERGLAAAVHSLEPGARLAVITFHSLEDGLVKRAFKRWASDCICDPELPICQCDHRQLVTLVTRKPVTPTATEIARNPRSRSAKLRIVEHI